ncbi:MAG: cell division protein, partial [Segetibacter sp.]|nr:cell division protein [Segetibacter sp.]
PVERVFDLSRSITLHTASMHHTNEIAVAGITTGLIELNETVTWQAKHLFKTRFLQTKISSMTHYTSFTDEQVKGDFKMMKHEHYFTVEGEGTLMTDIFTFETPYGIFGPILNSFFLKKYMRKLLEKRNRIIKDYSETSKWKDVL